MKWQKDEFWKGANDHDWASDLVYVQLPVMREGKC